MIQAVQIKFQHSTSDIKDWIYKVNPATIHHTEINDSFHKELSFCS